MKKNAVKINENTLRQIVADSVKKVLNEMENEGLGDRFRGAVQGFRQGAESMNTTTNAINEVVPQAKQKLQQAYQHLMDIYQGKAEINVKFLVDAISAAKTALSYVNAANNHTNGF